MRNLWTNALTAIRHPSYLFQYVGYLLNRISHGKNGALVPLPWGHEIGGFVNFSEYRSAPEAPSSEEMVYLRSIAKNINELVRRPVIIDVGANIGVTTLFFSSIYPRSRIFCFEPAVSTFEVLVENLKRNAVDHVSAINMAVSCRVGELLFDMSAAGRANYKISESVGKGVSTVQAITLDEYCIAQGISEIDLLKVDTEGFERAVFEGAIDLLDKRSIARVYFEFCPALEESSGAQVGDAVRFLEEHGFETFMITDRGGLEPFALSSRPFPTLCNLVALLRPSISRSLTL